MKNIRITFGMPELLIVFSFLMFPTSKWFAIIAFSMGVFGKLSSMALEINKKDEEEKKAQESIDKFGNVIAQIVDTVTEHKPKKSSGSFH